MSAQADGERIRRRVIYSGRVQGVFFRATAADIARGRAVVGHVRNLPDGTVELEAEGPPGEVDAFLAAVEQHFAAHISDTRRTLLLVRDVESSFGVRY